MLIVCGFVVSQRFQANKIIQNADGFVVGFVFMKAISEEFFLVKLLQVAASIDPG